MTDTTTFYIKCSTKEAMAIRAMAKKQQRTIHNWLRVTVFSEVMKESPNFLYPPLKCELCGAFITIRYLPPSSRADGYAYSHPRNTCERSEKWFAKQPYGDGCSGLVELPMEASSPPTTLAGLQISQQLAELQGADPRVMAKSLASMKDILAAQVNAAVDDAAAGDHGRKA
jgi:hypothetical protein